jgi:hypothetical protein
LENDVTGLNYGTKGSAFIAANPDKTTVIVRQNSSKTDEAGNRYEVTPEGLRQWGAWYAYLKAKGYNTSLMAKRDYWTVPAPWPHLFDAEAQIGADHLAADAFVALRAREDALDFDTQHAIHDTEQAWSRSDHRRRVVASALGYDPRDKVAPKHKLEKPSTETVDELLVNLKTVAAPPSDELMALLKARDYNFPAKPEDPDS